jgi:hypothetical protein
VDEGEARAAAVRLTFDGRLLAVARREAELLKPEVVL